MLVTVRILMMAVGFGLYVNASADHDNCGGLICGTKFILNRRV